MPVVELWYDAASRVRSMSACSRETVIALRSNNAMPCWAAASPPILQAAH